MEERPLNERPAAKPILSNSEPVVQNVVPIEPARSGCLGGCLGCITIPFIVLIVIGVIILIASIIGMIGSASNSSSSTTTNQSSASNTQALDKAKSLCVAQVLPLSGVALDDPILNAVANGTTIKVNGSVMAGDFACVVDNSATQVSTAIWYPAGNGIPKSYVAK